MVPEQIPIIILVLFMLYLLFRRRDKQRENAKRELAKAMRDLAEEIKKSRERHDGLA